RIEGELGPVVQQHAARAGLGVVGAHSALHAISLARRANGPQTRDSARRHVVERGTGRWPGRARYFPATRFLKAAAALNLGTDVAGTWMVLPVAGLRAVRAGLSAFSNEPNPVIATLSPLATVVWIVSRIASTASAAAFLLPSRSEMAS